MGKFDRTKIVLGEDNFNKLTKANVLIVGVGGVGGYVAEFLTRTGVGNLTIVDFDKIDETNLNRQIIALSSNIGKDKVIELKNRLLCINENLNINAVNQRLNSENIDEILSTKFDYIVDAIDSKLDKASLILAAKKLNIPIISSMGTGNRRGIPNFEITDIFKTHDDGLAKVMRKLLKEQGINKLDVCYSSQQTIKNTSKQVGSLVYFPSCAASVISAFVVEKLIKTL